MDVEIAHLPAELATFDLRMATMVVFDVLRATTTMVAALANGAREIYAFGTLDEAAAAHRAFDDGPKVLAGERHAVRPEGFDLGNSPEEFTPDQIAGKTVFLATTNGTVAVRACATARRTFVASLCNATAMARHLAMLAGDNGTPDRIVMVCSGTEGVAGQDDIAGGATVADLLARFRADVRPSDRMRQDIANASATTRDQATLLAMLHGTPGGGNLHRAGLSKDVDYVAKVDRFDVVAEVEHRERYAVVRSVAR